MEFVADEANPCGWLFNSLKISTCARMEYVADERNPCGCSTRSTSPHVHVLRQTWTGGRYRSNLFSDWRLPLELRLARFVAVHS